MEELKAIGLALIISPLSFLLWYLYQRYVWYCQVIGQNPIYVSMTPILTAKSNQSANKNPPETEKVIAPGCSFRQYLKYLQLACLPYAWSVPIKYFHQMYLRLRRSSLTESEKRRRLAKMVLETSLVLGFRKRQQDDYYFKFENFRMPSREKTDSKYRFITNCSIQIGANDLDNVFLKEIIVNDEAVTDINEMFSVLNTVWCVYTHTLTHVMAGNVAEMNLIEVKKSTVLSDEFKQSIDDMHAVVSGMNESANHYPADIWGIPRRHLQIILGYNGVQQIHNHQNISECISVSNFVNFTMKARMIFSKHLGKTGLSLSTLSANTIFHSIDHYNMGKYFLHDNEEKSFLGIDSRMITSLLGDLNFDIFGWQAMKYSKCDVWKRIYEELLLIDKEMANKTHMFVSV